MRADTVHNEVELSIWPLIVGVSALLFPFAFMAHFSWGGKSFISIIMSVMSIFGILTGLFGWASEVYGKKQDVGYGSTAVIIFIISEVMLFGGLFVGYLHTMLPSEVWPPLDTPSGVPPLRIALILSVLLISSSLTLLKAEVEIRRDNRAGFIKWLIITIILGALFLIGQVSEWNSLMAGGFRISTNIFGTFFYTITGVHGSHVIVGLILQLFILILAFKNSFSKEKHTIIKAAGYYWHFVDAIWLVVLSMIYIIPSGG
jgi:cytochrome c oxidase subunit 3